MDLNSLNQQSPASVLTIAFFVISAVALFSVFFGRKILGKRFKICSIPRLVSGVSLILFGAFGIAGLMSIVSDNYKVLNESFHEKLEDDYGLRTQSTEYAVERAAADHRSILMTEDGNPVYIQPYRDGDTLTFYKVDRGELIKPRM